MSCFAQINFGVERIGENSIECNSITLWWNDCNKTENSLGKQFTYSIYTQLIFYYLYLEIVLKQTNQSKQNLQQTSYDRIDRLDIRTPLEKISNKSKCHHVKGKFLGHDWHKPGQTSQGCCMYTVSVWRFY